AELHAVANAPIFSVYSSQLGQGIVGGALMPIEDLSRTSASAAVRILNGEPPANIQLPTTLPGTPMYDWRELRRWNISENRLPPGSILNFREPTAWQHYKLQIISTLSIFGLEGILIVALLTNLIRRRRAERKLHESREQLGALLDTADAGIV